MTEQETLYSLHIQTIAGSWEPTGDVYLDADLAALALFENERDHPELNFAMIEY